MTPTIMFVIGSGIIVVNVIICLSLLSIFCRQILKRPLPDIVLIGMGVATIISIFSLAIVTMGVK